MKNEVLREWARYAPFWMVGWCRPLTGIAPASWLTCGVLSFISAAIGVALRPSGGQEKGE